MEPRATDRLHAAIQAGNWSTAQDLLADFRREVEESWHAARTEQERREIGEKATAFLQWARAMTIAGRDHTRGNLVQLRRRDAYSGRNPKGAGPGGLEA